jgi:hypothetical protein
MTIVKRGTKGTALTYAEMDENIRDLYEDTTIDRVLGNGNITTKSLTVGELNIGTESSFSFPAEDGDAGQVLTTDGAGNMSLTSITTSPSPLRENLDADNYNILNVQNIDVEGAYLVNGTNRPPLIVTYGTGGGSNFNVNPPSGFSMASLAGFIPSLRLIYFSGGVDGNDTLQTTYSVGNESVNVDVRNSEQRAAGQANYLALWYAY